MIPKYLIISGMQLNTSFWVHIIPALALPVGLFLVKQFMEQIPDALIEAAKLDGASELSIFFNIIIPLSKSVMSVLTVYFAIGYWNSYFPSVLYHGDSSLHRLGMYVRKLVIQNSILNNEDVAGGLIDPNSILSNLQLKYTVICVAVLPLILLYPFFSKYMKKGLMVGSLKG
jgi:putative aldouronate transport system permease protein